VIESPVAHQVLEGDGAEAPLADQFMPVPVRREWRLRIVQMQTAQVRQAKDVLPLGPDRVRVLYQVVACGVEVAGVGAETDAGTQRFGDEAAQGGKFAEVPPKGGPGARRGLQEDHDLARDRGEAASIIRCVAFDPAFPVIDIVARMRHQVGYPQQFTPPEFRDERRD